LARHCRGLRVFNLHPMRRTARTIRRAKPLGNNAFAAKLTRRPVHGSTIVLKMLIEHVERSSPKEGRIALPVTRQDIADYLGLTIETGSRTLHDLEQRGAIEIRGYHSIALRNQFVEERAEELPDLFEGIRGRQPKTKQAA